MSKRSNGRPSPVIADRLKRCRRRLAKDGVSAFLITNPVDYYYLTGFTGEDSAVLVTARDVHMISDGRFDQTLDHETPWATKWLRKGLLNAEIGNVLRKLKIKSPAVQTGHLTVADHAEIKKLGKLTAPKAAPPILAEMRRIKERSELAIMGKALRIAEEAFVATCAALRLGQTELELAARIEFEMKTRGASGPAFPTIVAEGPNAAHPHAHPGDRQVKLGSAVLFDWGAKVDGYRSDLTRVVFIGRIPPRLGEIYGIVLDAQMRAIAAIAPGVKMCDVDAVARTAIADAGYAKEFNHGLGHGLGLDVHEPPSLSWRSDEKLTAGTVVTVEPGIYLPGVGGVRIEDDVLVTPTGSRVLSKLPKRLEQAVIQPGS